MLTGSDALLMTRMRDLMGDITSYLGPRLRVGPWIIFRIADQGNEHPAAFVQQNMRRAEPPVDYLVIHRVVEPKITYLPSHLRR